MASVELINVTKRFGSTTVLQDLSLEVRPNEFLVFLGPSGCGKSTLLRMIAGLETVDAGEIHIDGRRVDRLPPGERGVAMVFQHYALYPHMTVRENMSFGLRNQGVAREAIEQSVDQAAATLEIEHLLERKPTQLSGGQRQRVAIGRAIVKEPKVFLFDEPLSNLDAALRARTRIELARLHQRVPSTMIFVTHDQIEAMTLADRIVLMNERRIEQIGTPMEIYTRPATEFVASFVGTPRINLLPAQVSAGADGLARASFGGAAGVQTGIVRSELPTSGDFRIGVRAEEVRVIRSEDAAVSGRAEVVERLGDRTLLHLRMPDGSPLVAEDAGISSVREGDEVGIGFDGSRVHLFDQDGRGYHSTAGESSQESHG